jgi:acyl-coenzyme A thioesterase PaaI-like protein
LDSGLFNAKPDPEHPGWYQWELADDRRFNNQAIGKILAQRDADGQARIRMFPTLKQSNLADTVHGGAQLAFMDMALFAAAFIYGVRRVDLAVTVDISAQFIDAGKIDQPLDAIIELLRETGRMVFLRGLLVQGDTKVAAFSGTIRKPSLPKA